MNLIKERIFFKNISPPNKSSMNYTILIGQIFNQYSKEKKERTEKPSVLGKHICRLWKKSVDISWEQ